MFAGKIPRHEMQRYEERVAAEGGKIVASVTAKLDYLVVGAGRGTPAAAKDAERLNRGGASIGILDPAAFEELFAPTAEEAKDMFAAGEPGLKRWRALCDNGPSRELDLSGADLRGAGLRDVCLYRVKLDGADLRGADLAESRLGAISDARFDGAVLHGAKVSDLTDCTLRGADLTGAHLNPIVFTRCDLSGAKLAKASGEFTTAKDVTFANADLSDGDWEGSEFRGSDFTAADFRGSRVFRSKFINAKLNDANLAGTDLTGATLAGADLSGADLRGANLADADLTGAKVGGADFTGANLAGAKLGGIDRRRATGLGSVQPFAGVAGPNVTRLKSVGAKSHRLETSAQLDFLDGSVRIYVSIWKSRGRTIYAGQESPDKAGYRMSRQWDGDTMPACMMNLARRWAHGTLHIGSIEAGGEKMPLKGDELKDLCVAAWCEALGVERAPAERAQGAEQLQQREQVLNALRRGGFLMPDWDRLGDVDLSRLSFEGADLAGAKLKGFRGSRLNFRGANFEKANLSGAKFHGCNLKRADLKGANLSGAYLQTCELNSAELSGTDLRGADLRDTVLRNAVLTGADLDGANLRRADLRGANFTSAKLCPKDVDRAVYDAKTKFPAGFRVSKKMVKKG